MHTAQLPPGHLFRAALLALALTVATLFVFAVAPGLDLGGGSGGSAPAAGESAAAAAAPAAAPRWLADPLASPALELARR